jgi:hypothetical protein
MSKTVDVLLSRRVTIGIGEAAGDHEAGAKVMVSESVADSIVMQGAGTIVVVEKLVKATKPTVAEAKAAAEAEAKELADKEAADKAADAATAAAKTE